MVIPDVIVCNPKSCDYPLWRKFIVDNRLRFNEVIIAITETHQEPNYTSWIRETMSPHHCQFVIPPATPSGGDWRNIAVNQALIHSYNAEWIWFTEQDYIIEKPNEWFEEVYKAVADGYDVIAHYDDGGRMHPACILIKRSVLNKTRREFGIVPDKYDHFYLLQKDIEATGSRIYTIRTGRHLNGLSSNMSLIQRGEAPNYKKHELNAYILESLMCDIKLHPQWKTTYQHYIAEQFPQIDLSPTPPLTFDEKVEAKVLERGASRAGE